MKFSEIVDQAGELLKRKGRVSYRALTRGFALDAEAFTTWRDVTVEQTAA